MNRPGDTGYLLVDNRLSGGELLESSTYTCTHCSAVVVMNPDRKRERGYCYRCEHKICDRCATLYAQTHECYPMQRRADDLREQAFREQAGYTPLPLIVPPL